MLIKAFLYLGSVIVDFILTFFSALPEMPAEVVTSVNDYMDLFFNSCEWISFFIPINYTVSCIFVAFAIMSFDKIYKLVTYVIAWIPSIGINQKVAAVQADIKTVNNVTDSRRAQAAKHAGQISLGGRGTH